MTSKPCGGGYTLSPLPNYLIYFLNIDIKKMFKSFVKFWWMSPEAIFETYQEKNERGDSEATTSLSVYRSYYK